MLRLLIVDDNEAMRNLLRERLADHYEIFDTGDPERALAEALEHKPDAILLDLMMPNFSGFEVCQTLASLSFTQQIPIFIVSGEDPIKYKSFCQNLGASGYFQKPVDFKYLKARLVAVLSAKIAERRAEVRIRLRVALSLKGIDQQGTPFEDLTVTENISANGFLCGCKATMKKDSTVEVFLCSEGEKYVGTARIVRIDSPETPYLRYGLCFVRKTGDWVLK